VRVEYLQILAKLSLEINVSECYPKVTERLGKMSVKGDKILGVEELAKFFGVSDQTIWRWCKSGKLPAFKIGSQWKIRQSDLNRAINQKVTKTKPGKNHPTLF
jgi:excisionase family DNA binding protein